MLASGAVVMVGRPPGAPVTRASRATARSEERA